MEANQEGIENLSEEHQNLIKGFENYHNQVLEHLGIRTINLYYQLLTQLN